MKKGTESVSGIQSGCAMMAVKLAIWSADQRLQIRRR